MNIKIALKILEELLKKGVKTFCLCPGGRVAPFVEILSKNKHLDLHSFFEERSAGFFALGKTKSGSPSVILTTSGTAAVELLPSVMEAYYSSQSLVIITTDRPLKQTSHGSPQTLKTQKSLFKDYCKKTLQISSLKDISFKDWDLSQGSLHLNISFKEPLLDADIPNIEIPKKEMRKQKKIVKSKKSNKDVSDFFKSCKKPLILVGDLKDEEKNEIKSLLESSNLPFHTEALSGLDHIKSRLLSSEKILSLALRKNMADGVIRIGGVPRCRFWRDLEDLKTPVLSLTREPSFKALGRKSYLASITKDLSFLKDNLKSVSFNTSLLKELDEEKLSEFKKILKKYPESEEAFFENFKKKVPENSQIFLGNSQPIRLWDLMAFHKKKLQVRGQTGVNGIDGLISHFLGSLDQKKNNFAFLGDLSLLYDMAGFWDSKKQAPWQIVVINNFGGQIFSRLFKNKAYLNSHCLEFSSLAKLWGINYKLFTKNKDFKLEKPYTLIEVRPDLKQTHLAFGEQKTMWK